MCGRGFWSWTGPPLLRVYRLLLTLSPFLWLPSLGGRKCLFPQANVHWQCDLGMHSQNQNNNMKTQLPCKTFSKFIFRIRESTVNKVNTYCRCHTEEKVSTIPSNTLTFGTDNIEGFLFVFNSRETQCIFSSGCFFDFLFITGFVEG